MKLGVIDWPGLASFAGIWVAAAAAPGGNMAFTVAISSRYGFWAGIIGACGFVTVLFGFMMAVSLGLGFTVDRYAPALDVLRWFGVGYLLYLAWRLWTADANLRLDGSFENISFPWIYLQGALICLTNPKVIIFIAFVLPQTVDPSRPMLPQLVLLGSCGVLLSLMVHATYSMLGHKLGRSVPTPRARKICNRIIAVIFVIAALGLATASL